MEDYLFTRKEGAKKLKISLVKFDELLRRKNDPLPHLKLGRRVLIPAEALREWINRQADDGKLIP